MSFEMNHWKILSLFDQEVISRKEKNSSQQYTNDNYHKNHFHTPKIIQQI